MQPKAPKLLEDIRDAAAFVERGNPVLLAEVEALLSESS